MKRLFIALLPLTIFANITFVPEPLAPLIEPAPIIKPYKSPTVAVLFSALIPGLGHYYLEDMHAGTELLGSSLLLGGIAAATYDTSLFNTTIATFGCLRMYSLFAAYRDAHLFNGNPPFALPRENLKHLAKAPFQWSVIKKPEVWGACVGALALATAVTYYAYRSDPTCATLKTHYIEPLIAFPVAIGEESLFRGLLQTSFSNHLPAWSAITLSSVLFGAAHIPNAFQFEASERWRYYSFSVPFISCLGAYMGWLTHKNHSLKESVALHAWYDFALMSAGALANKAMIGGKTQISYGWSF